MSSELSSKSINEISGEELLSFLQALWNKQLKLESVGVEDDFMTLGGQSVDMFRMLVTIEDSLDAEIDFDDFFENTKLSVLHGLLLSLKTNN